MQDSDITFNKSVPPSHQEMTKNLGLKLKKYSTCWNLSKCTCQKLVCNSPKKNLSVKFTA